MKKVIVYILLFFLPIPAYCQYRVIGGDGSPYQASIEVPLMEVWILNGLTGAEISFTSGNSGASHKWYKYKKSTAEIYPVAISEYYSNTSVIRDIEDGYGYFVGTERGPGDNDVIWIMDYNLYPLNLRSIDIEEVKEERCNRIKLLFDMKASPLFYYSYDGKYQEVDRHFFLEYDYMEWNQKEKQYETKHKEQEFNRLLLEEVIDAPLINTIYTLYGDQIAAHFGKKQRISSEEYHAVAIDVNTYAYVISDKVEKEELNSDQAYEAPLNIVFEAYSNDLPDVMYTWKIFKIDPATGKREESETYRYTTAFCEVNFNMSGTYDVLLEVKVPNEDELCFYDSQNLPEGREYRVILEESLLKLPNAFSPGSTFGSNDVYKIAYKSLTSFKATIFNRWGNKLYTWTDPDGGWDGRVNGKYVPTGVYFVVVEAKGADGKTYKKSSDINILRSKN